MSMSRCVYPDRRAALMSIGLGREKMDCPDLEQLVSISRSCSDRMDKHTAS